MYISIVRFLMKNLNFIPVLEKVEDVACGQKLSTIYFGKNFEKEFLILKYESSTLMVILKDNELGLVIDFVKSISCRNNVTIKGIKIIGNKNIILLLDSQGKLWKLINAFEFLNEGYETFYAIKSSCFYEWIPFNTFRFQTIFQLVAYQQGFACLGIDNDLQMKVKIFSSCEPFCVEEYKFTEFNSTDSSSYFLSNIKLNFQESGFKSKLGKVNEALIAFNKYSGATYICSKNEKIGVANTSSTYLIASINFEKEKCLLLLFECGKLIFIFYGISKNYVTSKIAYLPKNIFVAEKCSCCQNGFLWLDCINLYHTEVKFSFNDAPLVSFVHLQINDHVKGIASVLKINNAFLCVTINNFYYQVPLSQTCKSQSCKKFLPEVISDINHASSEVKKLNEKIKIQTSVLKYKNFKLKKILMLKCDVKWEKSNIILKYLSEIILDKDFWKIKLEETIKNKNQVEIVCLETNLSKGMTIKIPTSLPEKGLVNIEAVGCFENEILFFKFENITGGQVQN